MQETIKRTGISYLITLIIASVLLVFVVGHIVYINFTYYMDYLHFDLAADLAFVNEASEQKTLFPEGWYHLSEVRLAHITTAVVLVYMITGDIHFSYPMAVSLMMLVNIGLFYYMLSYRKIRALPVVIGLLTLLTAFSYNVSFQQTLTFSIFSILFVNGSYALHLSAILLTVGVYMRLKTRQDTNQRPMIIAWTIAGIFAFVQGIQANRLLIGLYIPLLLVEFYPIIVGIIKNSGFSFKQLKKSSYFVLTCLVCTLAGIFLIQMLSSQGAVLSIYQENTNTSLSINGNGSLFERFVAFIPQFFYALGLRGGINVISAEGILYFGRILFLAAFAVTIIKSPRIIRASGGVMLKVFSTSVICLFLIMMFINVGIIERHIFTIVLLLSVSATLVVNHFLEKRRNILVITACSAVFIISVLSVNTLNFEKDDALVNSRQNVVQFIKQQGVTAGYGTVWQAEPIAAISDFEFKVVIINDGLDGIIKRAITQENLNIVNNEDRVFLVSATWTIQGAIENNEHIKTLLETGTRYDLDGGWIVYIFEDNPFRQI